MILIALAAPPAHADAPRLVLGYLGPQVTIERVLLVVRDDPPGTAHLVLSLAATHITRRELSAAIQLPAGARVTGFAYAGGGGERRVARPMPARSASETYGEVKASHGALVEAAGPDRVTLRAPIAEGLPAEIELELALPRLSALAIDPGGQTVRRAEIRIPGAPPAIWDDFTGPRMAALPRSRTQLGRVSPPGGVSAATSLVVGEAPVVVVGRPVTACCGCGGGARGIRRVVRQHRPQLRHCYMRVAQWNPQLAGTAVLHFTIAADGRVTSSSVSGDLGDLGVERCLAAEVSRWDFGAASAEGEIRVNYPLTFRITHRTGAVP